MISAEKANRIAFENRLRRVDQQIQEHILQGDAKMMLKTAHPELYKDIFKELRSYGYKVEVDTFYTGYEKCYFISWENA